MGDKSAIEWTDATWNPLIGCTRVGEGCDHCYAIGVVHRGMSPQHVGLTVKPEGERTDWTGEIRPVPHLLELPLRWKRARRIFVNSLSDMFHPDAITLVSEYGTPFIAEIVAVMVMAPQHSFQVLTKRPQIMAKVLAHPRFRLDVNAILLRRGHSVMPGGMTDPNFRWPSNIWWGTSIELDKYTFRADHLRLINGVRWISAEPLLGPLPSLDLTGIDWVVAGGESGPGARPMHPQWVRDLRDRCGHGNPCLECRDGLVELSFGRGYVSCGTCPPANEHRGTARVPVAFLFKQWGDWSSTDQCGVKNYAESKRRFHYQSERFAPDGVRYEAAGTMDVKAPGGYAYPNSVSMLRVGKRAAGRMLDGRTWDEYPQPKELCT